MKLQHLHIFPAVTEPLYISFVASMLFLPERRLQFYRRVLARIGHDIVRAGSADNALPFKQHGLNRRQTTLIDRLKNLMGPIGGIVSENTVSAKSFRVLTA